MYFNISVIFVLENTTRPTTPAASKTMCIYACAIVL